MMIQIRVLDKNGKEKLILLNENAIVSIEEVSKNMFNVFLVDGRVLNMNLEMFTEHFEQTGEKLA